MPQHFDTYVCTLSSCDVIDVMICKSGIHQYSIDLKKVQIGNDQEMAQSERNSHSINQGVGKKLK